MALKPDHALKLPERRTRDQIQIRPQPVKLFAILIAQNQFAQRPIIAEIPGLAVQTRIEQMPLELSFPRIGIQIDRRTLGHHVFIREDRGKSLKGFLILGHRGLFFGTFMAAAAGVSST